jgi:hypothetical protein
MDLRNRVDGVLGVISLSDQPPLPLGQFSETSLLRPAPIIQNVEIFLHFTRQLGHQFLTEEHMPVTCRVATTTPSPIT